MRKLPGKSINRVVYGILGMSGWHYCKSQQARLKGTAVELRSYSS